MATVQDIIDRAEALLDRKFQAASPAALLQAQGLNWIKDCYDLIADRLRVPTKLTQITSVASQRAYSLPADIWDGIDGVLTIEFNGEPLVARMSIQEAMDRWGKNWTSPPDFTAPTFWLAEDDTTKFSMIPPPGSTVTNGINVRHVQEVTKPANFAATVPTIFQSLIASIPLYLAGRAMELDRQGRGAAYIAEFEGRLIRRFRQKSRRSGRITASEAYTKDLYDYRISYGKVTRR